MIFLDAAEVRRLRTMEKIVGFDWQAALLNKCNGPETRYRLKVLDLNSGPTRGELHVYARQGTSPGDFSTGLILYDLDGDPLRIIRMNGPHSNPHVNRFPKRLTFPVTPHVHYLTERYQRERQAKGKVGPDGYALCTTAYSDIRGALMALARRTNLIMTPLQLPFPIPKGLP